MDPTYRQILLANYTPRTESMNNFSAVHQKCDTSECSHYRQRADTLCGNELRMSVTDGKILEGLGRRQGGSGIG